MIKSSDKIIIEFIKFHNTKDLSSKIVGLMGRYRILKIEDVKMSDKSITFTADRPLFIDDAISFFYLMRAEGYNVVEFSYTGEQPIPTKLKIEWTITKKT